MKGPLLLKNLREAVNMAKRCESICEDFERHRPPGMVYEWKMMKRRWEMDPSQQDPYEIVEKGKATIYTTPSILTLGFAASSLNAVKRKLAEIEALEYKSGSMPPHKLSPSSFIRMGLELEDQQCVPRYPLWCNRAKPLIRTENKSLNISSLNYHGQIRRRWKFRSEGTLSRDGSNSGRLHRLCTCHRCSSIHPTNRIYRLLMTRMSSTRRNPNSGHFSSPLSCPRTTGRYATRVSQRPNRPSASHRCKTTWST